MVWVLGGFWAATRRPEPRPLSGGDCPLRSIREHCTLTFLKTILALHFGQGCGPTSTGLAATCFLGRPTETVRVALQCLQNLPYPDVSDGSRKSSELRRALHLGHFDQDGPIMTQRLPDRSAVLREFLAQNKMHTFLRPTGTNVQPLCTSNLRGIAVENSASRSFCHFHLNFSSL